MNPLQVGDTPAFDAASHRAVPDSAALSPDRAAPAPRPALAAAGNQDEPQPVLCILLAPMLMEAAALRHGLADSTSEQVRTRVSGVGPRRARRAAVSPETLAGPFLAIAGLGTALSTHLHPGDVVVIDEVRTDALTEGPVPATRRLPAAPSVAAALRRQGLTVHIGSSISTDRLGDVSARERLAQTGALIADRESAWLLNSRRDRPAACVRVVAGGTGLIARARALRTLPRVAAGLADWATTIA